MERVNVDKQEGKINLFGIMGHGSFLFSSVVQHCCFLWTDWQLETDLDEQWQEWTCNGNHFECGLGLNMYSVQSIKLIMKPCVSLFSCCCASASNSMGVESCFLVVCLSSSLLWMHTLKDIVLNCSKDWILLSILACLSSFSPLTSA